MTIRLFCLTLATALAFGACGGDDPPNLAGMYVVTYHTHNEAACDAEGAEVSTYAYFQLAEESLEGQPYLTFKPCFTTDPATCNFMRPVPFMVDTFFQRGRAWTYSLTYSRGGISTPCNLHYREGEIIDLGDGAIRIVSRAYSEEDTTLSEAECSPNIAAARGATMPCLSYEVIEAELAD